LTFRHWNDQKDVFFLILLPKSIANRKAGRGKWEIIPVRPLLAGA
jgi:hypothetical protein